MLGRIVEMFKFTNGHANQSGHSRLTTLERISFKLAGSIGTPLSLFIHTLLLVGIFGLRYFGLTTDHILLILVAAVSLEAIYLAIFAQTTVRKTTGLLEEMESEVDEIRQDSFENEKAQRLLLYLGHQIKTIQTDLDSLKKSQILKSSGNGSHKGAHV